MTEPRSRTRSAETETPSRSPQIRAVPELVGEHESMYQVRALIDAVARTPETTVLIEGESGVGKEVVAQLVHARSARASGPFVAVNCATLSHELADSQLFGHMPGAFTGASARHRGFFEQAQGGTLLLDEIGELPLAQQPRLLRVLEERKVRPVGAEREIVLDVRVIAATNRDLAREVQTGAFRRDLHARLAIFPIHVPPLRERIDDVGPLTEHFLPLLCEQLGRPIPPLDPRLVQELRRYPWPGNVRELRGVIERALILADGAGNPDLRSFLKLRQRRLTTNSMSVVPPHAWAPSQKAGGLLDAREAAEADRATERRHLTLEEAMRRHIESVLADVDGNISQASRILGITRARLRRLRAGGSHG